MVSMNISLCCTSTSIWKFWINTTSEHHDLKQNIAGLYRTYTGLKERLASFQLDEESRLREMDFLRFEIDEIEGQT